MGSSGRMNSLDNATSNAHIKCSLNGIEGMVFRKDGQGRRPEAGDGGTFKRVDIYSYYSECGSTESGTGKGEK